MKILFEKHSSKRRTPINLNESDTYLFAHELNKEIRETHLLELESIYILKDTIFDLNKFKLYTVGYSRVNQIHIIRLLQRLFLLFKREVNVIAGIWIIDNWSEGYFHWFTDALPRLIAFESFKPDNDYPILLPETFRKITFITQSLELFQKRIIWYNPHNLIKVKTLILPSITAETGNYNNQLINRLRNHILKNYSIQNPNRKIFISRKKAKIRKITNETEVENVLTEFGYEIHCFEDYSFFDQCSIMAETKSLVGLHGAGLTNMLFMQPNGQILELRILNDSHSNCYFSLASELQHRYYYLQNKSSVRDTHIANITVDLDRLRKILQVID